MESSINSQEELKAKSGASFGVQWEELLLYGTSYLNARMAAMQHSTRQSVMSVLNEVAIKIFFIFLILLASAFILYGISIGIGKSLGEESWLGFVIVGGSLVLIGFVVQKTILFKRKKEFQKNVSKPILSLSVFHAVQTWVRENLVLSFVIAAISGFTVSLRLISNQNTQEVTTQTATRIPPIEKNNFKEFLGQLMVHFFESTLKSALAQLFATNKKIEHENALKMAQQKMDEEGGNRGIPYQ